MKEPVVARLVLTALRTSSGSAKPRRLKAAATFCLSIEVAVSASPLAGSWVVAGILLGEEPSDVGSRGTGRDAPGADTSAPAASARFPFLRLPRLARAASAAASDRLVAAASSAAATNTWPPSCAPAWHVTSTCRTSTWVDSSWPRRVDQGLWGRCGGSAAAAGQRVQEVLVGACVNCRFHGATQGKPTRAAPTLPRHRSCR